MFGLFQKETKDDLRFGLLTKQRGVWTGTLRTLLFPEVDLPVSLGAREEEELSACRTHLEQVMAHSAAIRSQIASEAWMTYQMYQKAEGDAVPYADITSPDDIWPLIKPQLWQFERGGHEFKSWVIMDFAWPNPHCLVAYLTDTDLYQLGVEG